MYSHLKTSKLMMIVSSNISGKRENKTMKICKLLYT